MKSWRALGGMLTSPLRTLRTIVEEGLSPTLPLVLFLLVIACAEASGLGRLIMLFDLGPEVIARRMRDAFFDPMRTDVVLLTITCAVLAALARALAPGRLPPARTAAAGVWLLVPLAIAKIAGATLAGLSLDLWWMPHHAVDSWAVIVDRQVSWPRFATKCVTAYAWPFCLASLFALRFRQETWVAPEPRRARIGLAILSLLMVALVASTAAFTIRIADRIRPTLVGDQLPDSTMRRLDASGVTKERVKLSTLRGKVLLLDFWASWCAPCRRSMPELSLLAEELGPRGLVVLGVNREPGEPKAAAKVLDQLQPKFEVLIDERGYGDRLGLTTLPTSYLVDRTGVVRAVHLGYADPALLRTEAEALLGEP